MTTRQEAVEDLSMFGIEDPKTYLVDMIPLAEMIWADGEVQESEFAILDEYLHERVQQINEMAGYSEIFWRKPGSMVPFAPPLSPKACLREAPPCGTKAGERERGGGPTNRHKDCRNIRRLILCRFIKPFNFIKLETFRITWELKFIDRSDKLW